MSSLIAWKDYVKGGTVSAYGTATVDLPVTNLQTRALAEPARWSAASNSFFGGATVNFAQASPIRVAAFFAHTISATTIGYELRIYSGANGTGTELYTAVSILPTLPPVDGFPRNEVHVLPSTVTAQSMRIVLYGNSPNTAWSTDIGRLWAGPALVLEDGIQFDWRQRIGDDNLVDVSRGRQVYVDETLPGREFECSVQGLTFEQCYNSSSAPTDPSMQLLGFECGLGGEMLVLPRLASAFEIHRLGVYGQLRKHVEIGHTAGNYFASGLQVSETR